MQDNIARQFQSQIMLAGLSLIPNDALRYTLLVIGGCAVVLYAIHVKSPSTQLGQLEGIVQTTDGVIQHAEAQCARDLLNVVEARVRLLRVKRSVSNIQCRVLETGTLTWRTYRQFSRDISDCAKDLESIQTDVQLIVEAERQRRYTDDMNEMEIVLARGRSRRRDVRLHEWQAHRAPSK